LVENGAESPESLAQLAGEVADLKDLFRRRLLEDRQKKELYDALYGQLEASRAGLVRQMVEPVLREVVLVLDRLEGLDPDDALAESVRAELFDVLARRGVEPIDIAAGTFDPSSQEIVDVIDVDDPTEANQVVRVQRRGYRYSDAVLRPAQVVVNRFVP
jgi:molecular chaperone GrpE